MFRRGIRFWRSFGAAYSFSAYQSGFKQIDFAAIVHLSFDKFETHDLTLGLSVGPRRSDCRPNRRFILRDAIGERGDETSTAALDPWDEGCFCFAASTQAFIEMQELSCCRLMDTEVGVHEFGGQHAETEV